MPIIKSPVRGQWTCHIGEAERGTSAHCSLQSFDDVTSEQAIGLGYRVGWRGVRPCCVVVGRDFCYLLTVHKSCGAKLKDCLIKAKNMSNAPRH